jgi:subtilisin-like proprotein convertase family protein
MKKFLLVLSILIISASGFGQEKLVWTTIKTDNTDPAQLLERKSVPTAFNTFNLDMVSLKTLLASAPSRDKSHLIDGVLIKFPDANGDLQTFKIYEASILHPDLARKHPEIASFAGMNINDPSTTIRFSITMFGFHGMIMSPNGTTLIDPYTKDRQSYIVYAKSKLTNAPDFECGFIGESVDEMETAAKGGNETQSNTGIFRVYRLALSSTIEYSAYHVNSLGQGSASEAVKKSIVLNAMTVTMTRVNGVYERDFSLTMQLIPNNTALINITSDNFSNNSGGTMLGQNQTFVDTTVGNGSYDIGHVFSTGGGGVAALGSVCSSGSKARGVTGSNSPIGDGFDIDYVAHEMGHQFGATHTFSSTSGGCGGNISTSTAVEPGSGSTIMAYAALCSPHNVQNFSDAYFHARSMQQIDAHITGAGNCAATSVNHNQAPQIVPLPDFTIPKSTSFVLRANASDPDGDILTYCWEQNDAGAPAQPPVSTSTVGPTFRSRMPSISPNRYFPPLGSATNTWEVLPSVPRTMNFALTVRDNNVVSGGQTNRDDVVVTVANVGPFVVTSPNSNVNWAAGSTQTVTWDVAGTNANGINSNFVDIYLSTNGGSSYPVMLASKVPNDGSEEITVPNTPGTQNRIMVMANDNIFYDVSNANFTISAPTEQFAIAFNGTAGGQNKGGCIGSNVVYTFNYSVFGGFSGTTTFSVTGTPPGTEVNFSPASTTESGVITMTISNTAAAPENFYPLVVSATSGGTTKNINLYLELIDTFFAPSNLLTPANNSTGVNNNVTLTWQQDIFNVTSYDVQVATDVNFTNIVASGNTVTASFAVNNLENLTDYYWRILPKNNFCDGNYSPVFTFRTAHCGEYVSPNVPMTISATGTPTVNSTLTITNEQSQTISDISVNVDISHTWIRDLTATLIAPNGTQAILFANVCPNSPGYQNAVASFGLEGNAISCNTTNPAISGRLLPVQSLNPFIGMSSEGTWTLRVSDSTNQDGGSINAWSLNICGLQAPLTIEDNAAFSFTVYPNPSKGSFMVKSDKISSESAQIQVYDIQGRLIYDRQHTASGMLDTNVELNNASAGVYLLSVSDGQNREVRRIIVE